LPKVGVRELGTIVPGDRLSARGTLEPPAPAGAPEPEPPVRAQSIHAADAAGETDLLGLRAPLAVLAALAVHARAETPVAIGLLGPPGTGKSSALRMLVQAVAAAEAHVVAIDAARLGGPAVVALADRLHESLAGSCPTLVNEAMHASRDPHRAARDAFDALDAARRKLSGERLALETEEVRRAGLAEAVLFEAAGTRIDAYARANRNRFKNRLAGLGLRGEPILAFKRLVQQAANGGSAKLLFVLRSFWAFKGQLALLLTALLLLLAGFGLGYADAERAAWLGRLREADSTRAAADWLEANIGLLATLREIAFGGAGLAVCANIFRALRLILPVFRATTLLKDDLARRRQQADVEFGHETRRVESLAAEVDALARRAAEAERRAAEDQTPHGATPVSSPFLDDPRQQQAERFIAAVGRLVARTGRSRPAPKGSALDSPDRIVIALDGLDGVAPSRACDILAAAHGCFAAGFVMLIAADPARLKAAAGDHGLASWIQVPFQVGEFSARSDLSALVRAMLDPEPSEPTPESVRPEPKAHLDEPITEAEARLLEELALLAGRSPRAVKRFVNLYRLARGLCPDHKGMLALMLALDAGGTEAEIEAFDQALGSAEGHLELDLLGAGPRLTGALASVRSVMGDESLAGARRAAETARLFSFGRPR